jgi:predicted nucleic-acid-binding Zn-ribbon protein
MINVGDKIKCYKCGAELYECTEAIYGHTLIRHSIHMIKGIPPVKDILYSDFVVEECPYCGKRINKKAAIALAGNFTNAIGGLIYE